MFIVVSGNGNSLGQIISGNVCSPVIECLPMSADRGAEGVCPQRLSSGGYYIIIVVLHERPGVPKLQLLNKASNCR